jgi:predicted MFS family arabinose efflux permease/quinol monooxygenase YgiN
MTETPDRAPHAPEHAALSPFRHRAYAVIWSATVVANIGSWMYSSASAWLMTTLTSDPLMVSLVQVAASLPLFLFALPAGALADIVDQRRLLLALEIVVALLSAAFAAIVSLGLATPVTLLVFTFLIEAAAALSAPAWQSIVPQLVPREDLPAAVAVNSVGINISRALGPGLGGLLTAAAGIAAPLWVNAVSNIGTIGGLLWWRTSRRAVSRLPAERFASAIRAGVRHARNNRHLRATLVRAVAFFLFASAYWALLPLVARERIAGGPELYGLLLGAIGAGAVAGAFALPRLKKKLGADRLVAAGTLGTAASLCLFGATREPYSALAASLIAGASWIAVLSSLNVSAQLALPEWVRGRGLALYVTFFFGAMTLGSALWGQVARMNGLPAAHFIAAALALLAIPLTWRWKLQTGAGLDLTPSAHWPAPIVSGEVESDAGPVLVTVEYRVEPKNREPFLAALDRLASERGRDGAYAWGIYEDTAERGRFVETFLVESWLEHLRQHERVTHADRILQERIQRLLREAPRIAHLIAVDSARR